MPEPFGKYLLLETLAVGGMGEVHLAKAGTPGFERFFAIKRILTRRQASEQFAELLMNEARITIGLNHPNIAQVFEFGNLDGHFFLVMEYVEGLAMRRVLAAKEGEPRLSPADAAFIAIQICRALAYAHDRTNSRGEPLAIIHRDVTPHNILIDTSGSVKLIDFGVAKAASNLQETETGTIKGKIGYMSPEQARGEKIDRRSDIYSVGVLLFEALTYRRMFSGDTVVARLHQLQTGETPQLDDELVASLPETLCRAVDRALAFAPDDRYPNAADMERDLSRALGEMDDAYTPHGLAELVRRLDTARDARAERFRQYEELSAEGMEAPTVIAGKLTPPPDEPTTDAHIARSGPRPALQGTGTVTVTATAMPAAPIQPPPPRRKRRALMLVVAGVIVGIGAIAAATHEKWLPRAEPVIGRVFPSLVPSWKPGPKPEPKPVVAEPAEPAELVLRTLDVRTRPRRARVWVDGQMRGLTPLLVEDLDATGSHLVRVEKQGFAPHMRVLLPAEERVDIKVRLRRARRGKRKAKASEPVAAVTAVDDESSDTEPMVESTDTGCVAVEADPWAHVEIDGHDVGKTPIECVSLTAGRHRVVLRNADTGAKKAAEVEVMAGQTTTLSETMTAAP